MSVTGPLPEHWLRRRRVEIAWVALACANYAVSLGWTTWQGAPFRLAWIGLIVAYGVIVLRDERMMVVIFLIAAAAVALTVVDALHVLRLWDASIEIPPVMALLCAVLVWRARRQNLAMQEMRALAESRRALLEEQTRFVQDASHELRTPLTIARGHLELLQSRVAEDRDLGVALQEMGRLNGIIERLLLLAAAGQPDFLRRTEVDIEELLSDVFLRWAELAPRSWRLAPIPAGRISLDAERVRTALDALLENAVKHTSPGDPIELRGRPAGDGRLLLEVADQGEGVSPEALPRIFERFGRGQPVDGSRPGCGLGLAIVEAIAEAHGGRCTVQSSAGGCVFGLELPGLHPAAVASEPARPPTSSPLVLGT